MLLWIIAGVFVLAVWLLVVKAKKAKENEKLLMQMVEAADRGDKAADEYLGKLFREHLLTSEEHNRIRKKVYEPKAKDGDAVAQYWMGFLCQVCEHDVSKAKKWYLKAAEQGNTEAMASLAFGYSKLANDEEQAAYFPCFGYKKKEYFKWLNKGVEAGDMKAACKLALEYSIGEEIEKDDNKALELYQLAADNHFPEAYVSLAKEYGCVIKPYYDKEKELEYLYKAMNSKNEDAFIQACMSLGYYYGGAYMYENAKEHKDSSKLKATYCFCLAYALGEDYAQKNLKEMKATVSEADWQVWRNDVIHLEYNKAILGR